MQIVSNKPKLNSTQVYLISRALDRTIKKFFENPENEKAFMEWKSKKEVENGANNGANSSTD